MTKSEYLNPLLYNPDLKHYLIANPSGEMTSDIYRYSSTSEVEPLYLDTDLAGFLDISPYVTQVSQNDALLGVFEKNAQNCMGWSGIIISVGKHESFSATLEFLRHRLFTLFSLGRKGILHFHNPSITHYLIGNAIQSERDKWLGPIRRIHWFAPCHCEHDGYWCSENNLSLPDSVTEISNKAWVLTPSQEAGLEQLHDDKLIRSHFDSENIRPNGETETWKNFRGFLKFGEAILLEQPEHLKKMMKLLRQYGIPKEQSLKESLTNLKSPEQKLQALEAVLQKENRYAS